MGVASLCCESEETEFTPEGFSRLSKVDLYGDLIQAETRCILVMLELAGITY